MKVLSLTQPFATLVIIGAKRFETRSWWCRHRGPLLIHASKGFPNWSRAMDLCFTEPFHSVLERHFNCDIENAFRMLPLGCILGSVTLANVMPTPQVADQLNHEDDEQELAFGDYSAGRYAWELLNPNPFPVTIPAKGMLGLWEFDLGSCATLKERIDR